MEARRKSLMENAALYDPSVFENRRPTVDVYGAVKTARIGQVWEHRYVVALFIFYRVLTVAISTGASAAGVHRQSQAGISPGPYGAYSICLSGRYNDEDRGDRIVYTGTGGQADDFGNPTGHPTEDQSEDHPMNKSLIVGSFFVLQTKYVLTRTVDVYQDRETCARLAWTRPTQRVRAQNGLPI